ncbi:FCD domain-containing protein [Yinghuangia sp. ASG 101]|uniref:FadR/GntR family transcriptional regulator n=1 Tax=Yinghuangia sp. ASG 101 TaxID=2896848 RepID=UPI001E54EA55|nr:FCD domain-containing protein [Yinghuangia sp. ASG 101]UGQ11233.1 FCD domain-containing protein [Yinghuangia sp. ASG 101]
MAEPARSAKPIADLPAPGRARVGRQVRVPKTAELVAASLRRLIIRGELSPGDALPSESSLMEQFGVSRPTLREAFRVLESEALIDVRRGVHGGARVNAPDLEVAARYAGLILEYRDATLGDLYRASAVIEPACARMLAQKHTAADIRRLRAAVEAEQAALDDPMALVDAQDAFHALLVELTGNQSLILLTGILRYIVDRANASHVATDGADPEHAAQARKGHRAHAKLVDLIEAGKGDEAQKLFHRHITATDDVVNAADAKTVLDLLG